MKKNVNPEFLKSMQDLEQEINKSENKEKALEEDAEKQNNEAEVAQKKTLLDLVVEKGDVSAEEVQRWKEMYANKVYVTFFDEDEYYVYRYITRLEMKKIASELSGKSTMEDENEKLCMKCILYPEVDVDLKNIVGAGTFETLANQIKIISNFIPDHLAIEMIQKL